MQEVADSSSAAPTIPLCHCIFFPRCRQRLELVTSQRPAATNFRRDLKQQGMLLLLYSLRFSSMFRNAREENPAMPTATNLPEKSIDWLQDLIQLNIDSRDGFQEAADDLKTKGGSLASLFRDFAMERAGQARELQSVVSANAEMPEKSGSVAAATHRTWMNLRKALGGGDQAVLSEAERGEDHIKVRGGASRPRLLFVYDDFAATVRRNQGCPPSGPRPLQDLICLKESAALGVLCGRRRGGIPFGFDAELSHRAVLPFAIRMLAGGSIWFHSIATCMYAPTKVFRWRQIPSRQHNPLPTNSSRLMASFHR